jgi:positive regulator of sigma E activity
MTRKGLVREVRDDEALICPIEGSECQTCEARHACLSLSGGKGKDTDFWVPNSIGASPGDLVQLELSSSASLTIIASTFLVPVFLLFAGYLISMNGSDSQRAIGAAAGLVTGIVFAIIVNKRLGSEKNYNMQMVKVLERKDGAAADTGVPDQRQEGSTDD